MLENQDNFSKGSVRNALEGNYDFDVKGVLKEGWEITQKDKLAMLQGMGVTILVALMVVAFAYEYSRQKGIDFNGGGFQTAREIIMMILVAPFAAGLMMMGVKASVGRNIRGSHVIHYLHKAFSIIVASVLTSAFIQIGMLFFILPGLYLLVATGFTIPLLLDKGFFPSRAVIISIKVVNKQWLKFVQLYLVFLGLLMLGFVTFGLAMIWVIPFYYNVKGLLYRDIFGVEADDIGEQHQLNYPENNRDEFNRGETNPDEKPDSSSPLSDHERSTETMSDKSKEANLSNRADHHKGKDEYFDA